MALDVDGDEGEQHRGDGNGEHGAGDAEQCAAEQHSGERDSRMDIGGLRADARLEREVLDLLVEHGPSERDEADHRPVGREQADDDRKRDRDVGTDRDWGTNCATTPVQMPRGSHDGMPISAKTSALVAPLMKARITRAPT